MPVRDYYLVLGVSPNASPERIREAFHALALRYHPDRAGEQATALFQTICEAYQVLGDPASRASYDAGLEHAGQLARPAAARRTAAEPLARRAFSLVRDFEVVEPSLDEVLARFLRNFTGAPTPKAERLQPLDIDLVLPASEAADGGVLTLGVPVFYPCSRCAGRGQLAGFVCPACRGTRLVQEEQPVDVAVPAFVPDGTVLEVPLGGLGVNNLYLRLHVRVAA